MHKTHRERGWVVAILIISGGGMLAVVALTLLAVLLMPSDEATLWDKFSLFALMCGGCGLSLVSLGVFYARREHSDP